MVKHASKTTILTFLITSLILIPSVSAQEEDSGPEIEMVEPWPSDVGHNDYLYTDARIESTGDEVDAWYEVKDEAGNLEGEREIVDTVGDGYYVSPRAIQVEGGETYDVEVTACEAGGECSSKQVTVMTECMIDLLGDCMY